MTATAQRCTLITGASSGIGQATAVVLSATRRLILHGRDVERLEATRLLCAHPEQHLLWPYDLQDTEGLGAAFTALLQAQELTVEAFIHSAGMVTILPARLIDAEAITRIMTVNFCAAAQLVGLLTRKKVNAGALVAIVFISSIWSRSGARGYSLYSASKGALDAFMRSLAVELAPTVRVNSVLPGAVPSRMASGGFSDPVIAAKLQSDYPLGTGEPGDIAHMVEFLLSEQAKWITGQQFVVDGGRSVNMSLT